MPYSTSLRAKDRDDNADEDDQSRAMIGL